MKTNKMKSIYMLAFATLLFTSCEKVIDIKLKDNTTKLVIEGNITDEAAPYYVTLTKTVPFDQNSVYPPVTDATVTISDDAGNKDVLTHLSDGRYQTNTIIGVPGRTYSLSVDYDGQKYFASSTMPQKVGIDSLYSSAFKFGGQENISIVPVYQDPTVFGNNYRFILYINGVMDKSYTQWNDNVNNGTRSQRPIMSSDNDVSLKTGDVVKLEMQCIDKGVYTYYYALSATASNGPSGGTTPSNPPSNIIGDALGLFSAHCSETKTIVIP